MPNLAPYGVDMELEQAERVSLWKRIMHLDDLLHIAARANTALDIVTARRDPSTRSPLVEAIELHLQVAEYDPRWAARGQSRLQAGRIAQLSHEIGKSMPHLAVVDVDPTEQFLNATEEFGGDPKEEFGGTKKIRDLTSETVAMYEYIQSVRMAGQYETALKLAARAPKRFAGTGAEMYRGMFEIEYMVACLETKSFDKARDHLRRSDSYWEKDARARYWASGRGRHEFARGLLDIHQGQLGNALIHLGEARKLLTEPSWDGIRAVEQLSMTLAVAECSAATWSVGEPATDTLAACADALRGVEQIRGRWGVVARSPIAPAAVLRIVLGELARLVAQLPRADNAQAGQLGLRIALAAKQSGYAELVRAERTLLDDSLGVLVEEIVKLEQGHDEDVQTGVEVQYLADLRADLEHASSPLLAEIVLPRSVEIEPILERVHVRESVTLDFVQLPLADGREAWFRTTIDSPEQIVFEELRMGPGYTMLVDDDDSGEHFDDNGSSVRRGLIDGLTISSVGLSRGWALAADELLPKSVVDRLQRATRDEPLELLISPHMQLGRVPWNALLVRGDEGLHSNEQRVRLVERAVVAQIPMLSTLLKGKPEPVRGPALVWLEGDITNSPEQRAWGMTIDRQVAMCEIPVDVYDTRCGPLAENLAAGQYIAGGPWGLAYIACHGDGAGLRQSIQVGVKLTAARALSLPWPHNVVLAACHVGRVDDSGEGEPLGFVIAALARGARTVVAGLNFVADTGTGEIGRRLIESLDGETRLDHALRLAQLEYLDDRESADDLWQWALLTAFVR
jgi:hypothetical protein